MTEPRIGLVEILRSVGSWNLKTIKLADYIFGSCLAFILPKRSHSTIPSDTWKSILIIRPGGIGDAVFLLPFLRALRREFPSKRLEILCEKRNQEVFTSQKGLTDQVYCYDLKGDLKKIFRNQYDLIIDTEQWHYASALVAYFLKPKMSIGFGTRPLRAKLFERAVDYSSDAYEMENFQKLFVGILKNPLDIKNLEDTFEVDEESLNWAKERIPQESVCIFLGASIPLRRLTSTQSLDIIRFILDRKLHVVLLGGTDVVDISEEITRGITDQALHNFVGKTSLMQSAALIKRSKAFVGPDSGLMHLACAVGTPTVAIFGPGNAAKWAPRNNKHTIVKENTSNYYNTYFGYTLPTCHGSDHYMRGMNMDKIIAAIEAAIKKTSIL